MQANTFDSINFQPASTMEEIKQKIIEKLNQRYMGTPHQKKFNYKCIVDVVFVADDVPCADDYKGLKMDGFEYWQGLKESKQDHENSTWHRVYYIKNIKKIEESPIFNLQSAVDSLAESNKSTSPKMG